MTSICELCGSLLRVFRGANTRIGGCVWAKLCAGVFKGGNFYLVRPLALVSPVLVGLCAEWSLSAVSPCWRVPRWLGAGCGSGQGRAGAVVGTGLTPSLDINIPRLPAAVYSAGALGAAPTGPGGGRGDPATAQTFPSAQTGRQPCWPLMGGDKVVTPCFSFLGATSGALTWISQGLGDRQMG